MISLYRRFTYASLIVFTHFVFGCFTRCTLVGKENVPPRGPLIVISNHMNLTDPGLVTACTGRKVHHLAKVEVMRHPLAGFIAKNFGSIALDRGGRANPGAFKEVLDLLSTDQVVGIFPEGTRSRSGGLSRAKPGSALVALKSNAPILPVAITGTERIKGFGFVVKRPKIGVVIGEPFSLPTIEGSLGREQLQSLADMMMERVAVNLPPSYQGYYRRGRFVGETDPPGEGA